MNELDPEQEYLTSAEIVQRFPVLGSRWKVVRMEREGTGPPSVKVRYHTVYKPHEVREWLENGGTQQRT